MKRRGQTALTKIKSCLNPLNLTIDAMSLKLTKNLKMK